MSKPTRKGKGGRRRLKFEGFDLWAGDTQMLRDGQNERTMEVVTLKDGRGWVHYYYLKAKCCHISPSGAAAMTPDPWY